jgi:hypothetical protein
MLQARELFVVTGARCLVAGNGRREAWGGVSRDQGAVVAVKSVGRNRRV